MRLKSEIIMGLAPKCMVVHTKASKMTQTTSVWDNYGYKANTLGLINETEVCRQGSQQ